MGSKKVVVTVQVGGQAPSFQQDMCTTTEFISMTQGSFHDIDKLKKKFKKNTSIKRILELNQGATLRIFIKDPSLGQKSRSPAGAVINSTSALSTVAWEDKVVKIGVWITLPETAEEEESEEEENESQPQPSQSPRAKRGRGGSSSSSSSSSSSISTRYRNGRRRSAGPKRVRRLGDLDEFLASPSGGLADIDIRAQPVFAAQGGKLEVGTANLPSIKLDISFDDHSEDVSPYLAKESTDATDAGRAPRDCFYVADDHLIVVDCSHYRGSMDARYAFAEALTEGLGKDFASAKRLSRQLWTAIRAGVIAELHRSSNVMKPNSLGKLYLAASPGRKTLQECGAEDVALALCLNQRLILAVGGHTAASSGNCDGSSGGITNDGDLRLETPHKPVSKGKAGGDNAKTRMKSANLFFDRLNEIVKVPPGSSARTAAVIAMGSGDLAIPMLKEGLLGPDDYPSVVRDWFTINAGTKFPRVPAMRGGDRGGAGDRERGGERGEGGDENPMQAQLAQLIQMKLLQALGQHPQPQQQQPQAAAGRPLAPRPVIRVKMDAAFNGHSFQDSDGQQLALSEMITVDEGAILQQIGQPQDGWTQVRTLDGSESGVVPSYLACAYKRVAAPGPPK